MEALLTPCAPRVSLLPTCRCRCRHACADPSTSASLPGDLAVASPGGCTVRGRARLCRTASISITMAACCQWDRRGRIPDDVATETKRRRCARGRAVERNGGNGGSTCRWCTREGISSCYYFYYLRYSKDASTQRQSAPDGAVIAHRVIPRGNGGRSSTVILRIRPQRNRGTPRHER